ncbi:MAG: hypothetical protein AABX53_03910 [Nanoarchaeota archaeon]
MRSIPIEFNTVLALRARFQGNSRVTNESRDEDEYLPEHLESGNRYRLRKKGQRAYPISVALPLFSIGFDGKFSNQPIAIVAIESATHYDRGQEEGRPRGTNYAPDIWTKGTYIVESIIRKGDWGMLEDACMGLVIG